MTRKFTVAVLVLLFVTLMAASAAEAQSGYVSVYAVVGKIYCRINGSIGANGTATPAFPGASVQLVCVNSTNPPLTTTTKTDGSFSIQTYNPIPSDCIIVAPTPLSMQLLPSSHRRSDLLATECWKHCSSQRKTFSLYPRGFQLRPCSAFTSLKYTDVKSCEK